MATSAAQTKAQALNAKLEGAARETIDDIEKQHLRKVARKAFTCAIACYGQFALLMMPSPRICCILFTKHRLLLINCRLTDKAGTTGPSDALENCVQNCQMPHKQAQQYVQQVRKDRLVA